MKSTSSKKQAKTVRFKDNPFTQMLDIPVRDKRIKISILGKDNHILVNQDTNEILGTHIATFKKVDGEKFVKLFTENIALCFELSSAGIKAFNVLMWAVQYQAISKDQVDLESYTLANFIEHNQFITTKPLKLSLATFKRGLNELEKAQIIAKAMKTGRYFINPNFVFNGDRIAFSTVIERKKLDEEAKMDLETQSKMLEELRANNEQDT